MRLLHRSRNGHEDVDLQDHDGDLRRGDDEMHRDDTSVDDRRIYGDAEVHGRPAPARVPEPPFTPPAPHTRPAPTVARDAPAPDAAAADLQVRERTWTFAPGQLVSLAAGVFTIAVGVVALIRAGVDGSFGTPVVSVLGYDHTAWLGALEVGVGVLLLLAGAGARGRPLSVVLGLAMTVAGAVVLAESDAFPDELGLEREFGWPVAVIGGIVALAALLMPVWRNTTITRDDTIDLRDPRFDRTRTRTS